MENLNKLILYHGKKGVCVCSSFGWVWWLYIYTKDEYCRLTNLSLNRISKIGTVFRVQRFLNRRCNCCFKCVCVPLKNMTMAVPVLCMIFLKQFLLKYFAMLVEIFLYDVFIIDTDGIIDECQGESLGKEYTGITCLSCIVS